jgi:hypothetical protein
VTDAPCAAIAHFWPPTQHTLPPLFLSAQSELLKLGDTEIKSDSPCVFLVDLAQAKISFEAVNVALPDEVPALGETAPALDNAEGKAWASTMMRVVEQFKSPEVKRFLEP